MDPNKLKLNEYLKNHDSIDDIDREWIENILKRNPLYCTKRIKEIGIIDKKFVYITKYKPHPIYVNIDLCDINLPIRYGSNNRTNLKLYLMSHDKILDEDKEKMLTRFKKHPYFNDNVKEVIIGKNSEGKKRYGFLFKNNETKYINFFDIFISNKFDYKYVFRNAVRNDIKSEKKKARKINKNFKCEWCGKEISDGAITLDHCPEFSKILDDFLKEEKINKHDIKIKKLGTKSFIENKDMLLKWRQYHKNNFKYKICCYECNVNRGKEHCKISMYNNN